MMSKLHWSSVQTNCSPLIFYWLTIAWKFWDQGWYFQGGHGPPWIFPGWAVAHPAPHVPAPMSVVLSIFSCILLFLIWCFLRDMVNKSFIYFTQQVTARIKFRIDLLVGWWWRHVCRVSVNPSLSTCSHAVVSGQSMSSDPSRRCWAIGQYGRGEWLMDRRAVGSSRIDDLRQG